MKAIILAAGQGRRLLPWTRDLPKCLLPFAGRSLLSWQLAALAANAVRDVVVVTGFAAHAIEGEIARATPAGMTVTTLFNPFHGVAENIVSCWMARDHLGGDLAVINGDTLFEPRVLTRARKGAKYPVNVTTDIKAAYDVDDMKVQLAGDRVAHIGKVLPPEQSDAESIGLLLLRGPGASLFTDAVEAVMRQPGGVSRWYLSAVEELAARQVVGATSIAGLGWTEVDYPADLARAEALARSWAGSDTPCEDRLAQ
ncbi:MAG: phosphocholine cytidylyltransferase family protein [Magnetospirillum sp.]|nr:phosphocholine cytidylyltransferase family protein [Magnetospirillum sp.]